MKRSTVLLILASCLLVPLASCSNTPLGGILQRSLEADPSLTGATPSSDTVLTQKPAIVQLPANFPDEIPRYPNSELQQVIPASAAPSVSGQAPVVTRWATSDSRDRVLDFYRQQLQTDGWQPDQLTGNANEDVSARQTNLQVTVTVPSTVPGAQSAPVGNASPTTEFIIRYIQNGANGQASPTPSPQSTGQSTGSLSNVPAFSDSTTIGISGGDSNQTQAAAIAFTDLSKTPKELQQYVEDVAKLGILTPTAASQKSNQSQSLFEPNKVITRREYARWLIAANNRLYANRSAQQIRSGTENSQPAFQDVPRNDPDFAAIQGLAEAGIIPSSLSGDSTIVTFNPDAPLTHESLLLWKVPMDTRQALPTANIDAIKQTWGFQDAARIDPRAQRAVLADFQNGDLSNIRRAFGYTTLFQPKKAVTRAEAAATLWYFGSQGEGQSARDALKAGQPNRS